MRDGMVESTKNPEVVTTIQPAKLTLAEVQERLAGKRGKRFWQSLDELSEDPGFEQMVREEFPRQASEWTDGVSRRSFMKVMGASLALAGMTGCTKQPDEQIFPYVKAPEDLILGKPMYFATAMPFPTGAVPVLVKTDAFRPIKIDGNPEHPMSKGKTDVFSQASLLDLYDPDRSKRTVKRVGGESADSEYGDFAVAFQNAVKATGNGQGLWFLMDFNHSPTFAAQWKQLAAKYPAAKIVQYNPVYGDASKMPAAQYKLENADVILSLDADFLSSNAFPGFLPMAAAYAARHRYEEGKTMNRLYVVETMPSVTGFKAEHRLALKPSDVVAFANALNGGGAVPGEAQKFFSAVVADLKKAGAKAVVVAGPQSPASVQAAAMAMNTALGAVGSTVSYAAPAALENSADFKQLALAMDGGQVKVLAILCSNPVYSAPADFNFGINLAKVPFSVHLGQHLDETGVTASWHLPEAHYLESWSDTRAADGTISIIQPLIDPLYPGAVSSHHVVQVLLDNATATPRDLVQQTAKTYIAGDFATGWRKALHDGWVEGTTATAPAAAPAAPAVAAAAVPAGGIEINFKADSNTFDGRYANNGWLQEIPKQVTRLAWDNAALMSMETLKKIGAEETQLIEVTLNGRKLVIPPLMVAGHAPDSITIHLGSGRKFGRVAWGVGANAYELRTSDAPNYQGGATAKTVDTYYDLCVTQVHDLDHRGKFAQSDLEHPVDPNGSFSEPGHEAMERGIIRYATLEEFLKNPKFANEEEGEPENLNSTHTAMREVPDKETSFFPNAWDYGKIDKSTGLLQNKWGMAIDLNSCIGCSSCVASCYAENNIPVVGREQVKIGRKMDWIRIDTYFEGDLHAPKAHFQPMLCQHCENAGCELVCPVGATVHTPEGLNTMVYNRCVGTRYCSNNCPYKVRRFNFLLYSDYETESLKLMRNPDVSVRSRGVMEKCTYCVQRIQEAKITADKEGRAIRDGEIVTACQQACPTEAIIFGNLNDPNARVTKRKQDERSYAVLGDLNYRPRTSYVAGVINPNNELGEA
ncbi:MAG: TAT-variant-translocated molybdopterin oxidoreductase [Acidobacteria bacterium]|nr:TAT-variant-translocated molybdopterin oxidoreductase [Acidobacteriota bacterium]